MKKPQLSILAVITILFAAFTLGYFLGTNSGHSPVTVAVPDATRASYIPTEASSLPEETADTQPVFPIDINTATWEDLTNLPGIGEVIARRIVSYREENGAFEAVEELLNVEGIGTTRMEEIIDLVTIGG